MQIPVSYFYKTCTQLSIICAHCTAITGNNSFAEFDDYYTSLRPRMEGDACNVSSGTNVPHSTRPHQVVNCRNVWFREFWTQHNKCGFDNSTVGNKCTGQEAISDYEQEGLVPFVGESWFMSCLVGIEWRRLFYCRFFRCVYYCNRNAVCALTQLWWFPTTFMRLIIISPSKCDH